MGTNPSGSLYSGPTEDKLHCIHHVAGTQATEKKSGRDADFQALLFYIRRQ
jgi:hypothetical protein